MRSFAGFAGFFAITLSPEALITSISSDAGKLLGYSPRELFLAPITRILADDSAFEVPQILNSAGKWGFWEGGMVFLSHDGQTIEGCGTLASLEDGENRPGGYLLLLSFGKSREADVGEDLTLEQVSRRLRAIAHDLNNPLAVAAGFIQLLRMNFACPAKAREDIARVHSGLTRVAEAADQLHAYAISLHEKSLRCEEASDTPSSSPPKTECVPPAVERLTQ